MGDRFTIADVVEARGLNTLRGGHSKQVGNETYFDCPFCGNTKGKMSYNIKKNVYHCWSCGKAGGPIDFWIETNWDSSKDFYGIDGAKNAIKDIFQTINGDEEIQKFHQREIKHLNNLPEDETLQASDQIKNKTNRALLKKLRLKKEHFDNLLNRGFSEEQILKLRFRSTPDRKDTQKICKELLSEGCVLEGVPGFYINKNGKWDIYFSGSGYLCPVYDGEHNYIIGFQIRLDEAKGKAKYLWVSSAGKTKGCSSGAMSTYLPGKNSNCIIITEGILKATLVWTFLKGEVTIIGIPGVNAKTSLRACLDRHSYGYVFEAFDMDKAIHTEDPKEKEKTENIALAAQDLREIISDEYKFDVSPLTWDFNEDGYWKGNFKGLDDFLYDYQENIEKFLNYIAKKSKSSLELQKYFNECTNH